MFELSKGGSAGRERDGAGDVFVAAGVEAAAEAADATAAAAESAAATDVGEYLPGRISCSDE